MGARSFGGIAGAAVAIAGGIGAAVGVYTLPAPSHQYAQVDVYGQAGQRAFTASTLWENQYGYSHLRIEAFRGHVGGTTAIAQSEGVRTTSNTGTGVHLRAEIVTCYYPEGFCDVERAWEGDLALTSLTFSPLMDGASFTGDAENCFFQIEWHPEGEIVPFEGHFVDSRSGVTHDSSPYEVSGFAAAGGFAEGSRVAKADIEMTPVPWDPQACDAYSRQNAPGYLTQGAGTTGVASLDLE